MKSPFFLIALTATITIHAQSEPEWKTLYRGTPEKQLSMVHTKLEVSFDYTKSRMAGKAWLTMTPHFYATDSAFLDAKGMWIHEVALVVGNQKKKLDFSYRDSMVLRIKLDRVYRPGEKPVIYVDYTARPDELKVKGSAAITNAKGLYFINPDGSDSTKPIQIWTQGETEATSVWCPTVDRPNQKTTQEISMTVPAKYVTLSNGILTKQVRNRNGTRTDIWKMDQPHAPYLMFMGVGDYAIIRDKYKNIPVDYYVGKEYASVAKQIYGNTPEMMGFFGRILNMEYPWPKYAQMTAVDYVSGAMENTTATLHASWADQNARQLTDGNQWETTIAHELFHHWFGDLVTMESFSNLTVNESFADYSEYLWTEYKYGRDAADELQLASMQAYMSNPVEQTKHLVRFFYREKEDMFDLVSYQKGGRILHMLRYELGDSAFFKGLNLYLRQYQYKTVEAHQLRMALEEVSGRDLNLFFNQWFFNNGHPDVQISYGKKEGRDFVAIEQIQKDRVYEIPMNIASYGADNKVTLHQVTIKNRTDTFYFDAGAAKRYYEADADRIMLWRKTENKTPDQWIAQYKRMGSYISRREALAGHLALDTLGEPTRLLMLASLNDPYHGIRLMGLRYFRQFPAQLTSDKDWAVVEKLSRSEKDRPTKATAIDVLSKKPGNQYVDLFAMAAKDSSYTVAGAALEALMQKDMNKAISLGKVLENDAMGRLVSSLEMVALAGLPIAAADSVIALYKEKNGMERLTSVNGMIYFASRLPDAVTFKNVLAPVIDIYRRIPAGFGTYKSDIKEKLNELLGNKEKALARDPDNKELGSQVDWLKNQI